MPAIVRIENLIKNYYLGALTVNVLKGIDVTVDEGDFVALMGPSGSGKSTLLNILGCLDRPTSGSYELGEVDVSAMDDDSLSDVRSRYLGFIFQSFNLLPQYTVVENIEVPLLYQSIKLNDATRAR
jgi:putative ABC transport system ATP-binding protein